MTSSESLKQAWQAQPVSPIPPTFADVQARAGLFHRQVRSRNRREYAACLLVVLFFGAIAGFGQGDAERAGAALIVLGCAFVAWQLHRSASISAPPADPGLPLALHQRLQLVRQRDALAGVTRWYLAPFMPGLLLFAVSRPLDAAPPFRLHLFEIVYLAAILILFGIIGWLNRREARALASEIDQLDAMLDADPMAASKV